VLHIERQGSVVLWTVDRPEAKNALDHPTLDALVSAIREAKADPDVRAAVITGAGDAFISGGDLRELRERNSAADAEELTDAGYALTSAIGELPFPVVAAVAGPAIGGGAELATACDLRVADERARFCFKQVRMGVTTAWGTVPRLVALVGAGAAARLLYTGQELGAAESKRLGLVEEVTDSGRAVTTAMEWAADIARGSPKAVADTKRLLREATTTARDVRALERQLFIETWSSADHRDAIEAYFERRLPRWNPR
jgi:enoyl-CoA hydratase